MEKLVKLLNEYEVYKGYNRGGWEMTSMGLVYAKNIRDKGAIIILKSKEYGFIKWLVENNKIDTDKLKFQSDFMFPLWKDFDQCGSEAIEEYSDYESLLMLLSIQDNPIEFLVKILK